ncbi:hypothetical protein GDO86_018507 [Hymenochirus boettgeri]|uniref:G-protein coupled receptors family 1 profile domain-containing protein n=1 Tax=Hymenochirus boettgeri TaxID=247094 RepID=A0A8T2IFY2_9PIPI|nr:hypothetical protein GDO86_018507 [Hymenochirus boettgeri]
MVSEFNISTSFTLLGLVEMDGLKYLYSSLLLLIYLLILLFNLIIVIAVWAEESLHQPMYVLIASLVLNGIIGSSSFFPKLIVDLVSSTTVISRDACFIQSFCLMISTYCKISTFTLMAYDTHLAVCHPLRYNSLMTNVVVLNLLVGSFFFNLIIVLITILLSARLPLCGSQINNIFCDNMSLFILSCLDSSVNNIFGTVTFAFYLITALLILLYSYIQIFLVCTKVSKDAGKKATHTVVTHLLIFSIFLKGVLFIFIRYRLENVNLPTLVHILLSMTALVFPPILTPLIYGLRTKTLKTQVIGQLLEIYEWRRS